MSDESPPGERAGAHADAAPPGDDAAGTTSDRTRAAGWRPSRHPTRNELVVGIVAIIALATAFGLGRATVEPEAAGPPWMQGVAGDDARSPDGRPGMRMGWRKRDRNDMHGGPPGLGMGGGPEGRRMRGMRGGGIARVERVDGDELVVTKLGSDEELRYELTDETRITREEQIDAGQLEEGTLVRITGDRGRGGRDEDDDVVREARSVHVIERPDGT